MKIELETLFRKSLLDGLNIFTGAGFSLNAMDANEKNMPTGDELKEELCTLFNVAKSLTLSQVASIIDKKDKIGLREYLNKRFDVKSFPDYYYHLNLLNIKYLFTTNIDNLPKNIFKNNERKYLKDVSVNGPSYNDMSAIDYYPLHGSIENTQKQLIFSSIDIATTFSTSPRFWNDLATKIEKLPTLFWGYSLSDSGILQTLHNVFENNADDKVKWIVLYKEMPDLEEYYNALGFRIIIASNEELLNYFADFFSKNIEPSNIVKTTLTSKKLFPEYYIPNSDEAPKFRDIKTFFKGAAPVWSDIYSKILQRTSHFHQTQNDIFANKNNIILGTPASGKSTLLMQLAAFTEFQGYKLTVFDPFTIEKAMLIEKKLEGKNALIFVDNFTDSLLPFLHLAKLKNCKVIGFDREHNFEIISPFIDKKEFKISQITKLTPQDFQLIFNTLPESIRTPGILYRMQPGEQNNSLFEFISLNVKYPTVSERVKSLIQSIEVKDFLLNDLLILCAYANQSRIPLSFDMALNYFRAQFSYDSDIIAISKEIYNIKSQLGELLVDYPTTLIEDEQEQDMFSTRSIFLADAIMEYCPSEILKRVLSNFIEYVPTYSIPNYHIFRRYAHDKKLWIRAFQNADEGKYNYEKLIKEDEKNPFLWQQGALYLCQKKKFPDAFYWIEKSLHLSDNRFFSITNSHAIILFDANINKQETSVKQILDKSMLILQNCYQKDQKKLYHAKKYAEQAIEYNNRYADTVAKKYLQTAKVWVDDEMTKNDWHTGLRDVSRKLEVLLS